MKQTDSERAKKFLIVLIPIIYLIFAGVILFLIKANAISPLPPKAIPISFEETEFNEEMHSRVLASLQQAQNFTLNNLMEDDGFIPLYVTGSKDQTVSSQTNSEALSYGLCWTAIDKRKIQFDKELNFIENSMQHPQAGYLMWRLEENRKPIDDGGNIASDADLRTIKALIIAKEYWGDKRYQEKINELATSLESIAITKDNFLAPYGGVENDSTLWKTQNVWLPYADFQMFRYLANTRGSPWNAVYKNMKQAYLNAQLSSGIYQTELTENRIYATTLDGGNYSIHSFWMMVRASESEDKELQQSAQKALNFYKESFYQNNKIYTAYSEVGLPASTTDAPWVYALVGRAAIELGDYKFSEDMMKKLLEFQDRDPSSEYYGAFNEGSKEQPRATQFTIQESILTLQTYLNKHGSRSPDGKVTS